MYDSVLKCFPDYLASEIRQVIGNKNNLEEIRVRLNLPLILNYAEEEIVLNYVVNREEISYIMGRLCDNSLYSYQGQLAKGYITIRGGHRVGIVGRGVIQEDKVINLNYISGLNFRVSRQVKDCSNNVIDYILDLKFNSIYNTLIISPPGFRKNNVIKRFG